jgi:hypothetical protein
VLLGGEEKKRQWILFVKEIGWNLEEMNQRAQILLGLNYLFKRYII